MSAIREDEKILSWFRYSILLSPYSSHHLTWILLPTSYLVPLSFLVSTLKLFPLFAFLTKNWHRNLKIYPIYNQKSNNDTPRYKAWLLCLSMRGRNYIKFLRILRREFEKCGKQSVVSWGCVFSYLVVYFFYFFFCSSVWSLWLHLDVDISFPLILSNHLFLSHLWQNNQRLTSRRNNPVWTQWMISIQRLLY